MHVERTGKDPAAAEPKIRVLGLYWVPSFWSLGRHMGASSFFLAVQAYARFGHEIDVSAPRGKGQPALEVDEGVRIHRYRGAIDFESNPRRPVPIRVTSRFIRYFYYLIIGTWNGVRLGRKVRPDLVVGYHYHCAPAAYLVGRVLGIPNLTRLFGTQLNRILDNPLKRITAFMQIVALRTPASYVIMHDDGSEGDVIARRLGVPPERLRFWRDGTDYALYRPDADPTPVRRALGIPEDHTILFCVGRFEEDKRMGRLVEILPAVLREEPRVTLLLVGDGSERPEVEARARTLGVADHLRITGAVPREELHKYFNLGDIFVGVSDRTNANLPPIEAMSCGKPVVALDTGGTRHLIGDGVHGVLVDRARWTEALPRALVDLLRDPARRRRLGAAAREKILREIPTLEERQRMEVEMALRAVAEFRTARKAKGARGRRTGDQPRETGPRRESPAS
jgi:glycosyltransferase involved in cell wall biosynthesis